MRDRLPDERRSIVRTFKLGENPFHLVVGLREDGSPGELMVFDRHQGSEAHALLDALLMSISIGLQSGIPLAEYVGKLRGIRYSPEGLTGDAEFKTASSKLDLVAQYLQKHFLN